MKTLLSYLRFDKLIAPAVLRVLFWPALAACIYYSSWLIIEGNIIGWVPLIVGSLFEGMLLFFTMNEKMERINQSLQDNV